MKKDYQIDINISGEGTPQDVAYCLRAVADGIEFIDKEVGADGFENKLVWEDSTLITEINLIDQNQTS